MNDKPGKKVDHFPYDGIRQMTLRFHSGNFRALSTSKSV